VPRDDAEAAAVSVAAVALQSVGIARIVPQHGNHKHRAGLRGRGRHGLDRVIDIVAAIAKRLLAFVAARSRNASWPLGLGRIPDDGLVLATWNGEARTPNALSKDWSEMMRKLGLSVSLHSLRHTHASQLIAAGMDVVSVSRRLGHASPTITLGVYAHLFSNTDDRAADIVAAALARMQTD